MSDEDKRIYTKVVFKLKKGQDTGQKGQVDIELFFDSPLQIKHNGQIKFDPGKRLNLTDVWLWHLSSDAGENLVHHPLAEILVNRVKCDAVWEFKDLGKYPELFMEKDNNASYFYLQLRTDSPVFVLWRGGESEPLSFDSQDDNFNDLILSGQQLPKDWNKTYQSIAWGNRLHHRTS